MNFTDYKKRLRAEFARPSDALAFASHTSFLQSGFVCVGSFAVDYNSPPLPADWSSSPDLFCFHYTHASASPSDSVFVTKVWFILLLRLFVTPLHVLIADNAALIGTSKLPDGQTFSAHFDISDFIEASGGSFVYLQEEVLHRAIVSSLCNKYVFPSSAYH